MSILVVGTVALDNVTTPFGKVKNALGGSATYSAVSASFFGKVKLVGIVGKDFPRQFISFLISHNIDTNGLDIARGKTFSWSGKYTFDLNNPQTLKTELNLLARFNPNIPEEYKKERFLFLANIDPHVQLSVLKQLYRPKLVVADTMNYWIEHEKKALKKVMQKSDILVVNDAEAREFSGESNLLKAAKALLAHGPLLVIIKRGEHGCSLFSPSFTFHIPAYLLEDLADPTGAGDTFAGGFLGYLASCSRINEGTFKKAIAYGTIMASFVVEDFSLNRLKKITKKDIQARFIHFRKMTRF
ncbi:MAG: sugar kinase [Candidatus Omnitrophica bacterium]|nr:sugar kinase [Candidatus Omnitrophota bacterium]